MASHPTVEDLEALRRPLVGLCYRMLGSVHDAEDAVQETLLKAHRALPAYDSRRARLSTWVHRIAVNECLDTLRSARRRTVLVERELPGDPAELERLGSDAWLEPMPTSRVEAVGDPGELVVSRESVRLAFLVAVQALPPRQRAVLLLREVLAFSAAESADVLEMSVPAVNSALQRARMTLAARHTAPEDVDLAVDEATAGLVQRFVAAFESHDAAGLVSLLRDDAIASMPPFAWSVCGAREIARVMTQPGTPCEGARLLPCSINGGVGFGQYRPDGAEGLLPFALVALELREGRISQIVTFLETESRFTEFGLPALVSPNDLKGAR